jgi:hypothetical protein
MSFTSSAVTAADAKATACAYVADSAGAQRSGSREGAPLGEVLCISVGAVMGTTLKPFALARPGRTTGTRYRVSIPVAPVVRPGGGRPGRPQSNDRCESSALLATLEESPVVLRMEPP